MANSGTFLRVNNKRSRDAWKRKGETSEAKKRRRDTRRRSRPSD